MGTANGDGYTGFTQVDLPQAMHDGTPFDGPLIGRLLTQAVHFLDRHLTVCLVNERLGFLLAREFPCGPDKQNARSAIIRFDRVQYRLFVNWRGGEFDHNNFTQLA